MNRYIGTKIKQVDERLLSIKPPDCISRVPRAASERAHWKGTYNVILICHIYILRGLLDKNCLCNMCHIPHKKSLSCSNNNMHRHYVIVESNVAWSMRNIWKGLLGQ